MVDELREHFDRAVGADPGADPGEMARLAIADGGRIRRRRRWTAAAGVAAVVLTVLGVVAGTHHRPRATETAEPPMTVAAAMMPVAARFCSVEPVPSGATDAVLFLDEAVTDRQRSALLAALRDDPRVATIRYESRAEAFARFRARYADSPDFVASVRVDQLPESFRLRLTDPSAYVDLRAGYEARAGVTAVLGRICPASAPVGGVQ